jgi:hypothetical protein
MGNINMVIHGAYSSIETAAELHNRCDLDLEAEVMVNFTRFGTALPFKNILKK